MLSSFLEKIIDNKKKEILVKKNIFEEYKKKFAKNQIPVSKKNFLAALQKKDEINIIAEIKKASPSKGNIFLDADIFEIAKIYEDSGVSAISFLTDKKFFSGDLLELKKISQKIKMPLLRKDFILCEEQILESRIFGADAILLMVGVIKNLKNLKKLIELTESLGMHALVETGNEEEIEIAKNSGAKIIGVNARNFSDLSIDKNKFTNLLPKISDKYIKIAESGINNPEDIKKYSPFCDAFLIGTSIMKTQDEKKIYEKINSFKKIK